MPQDQVCLEGALFGVVCVGEGVDVGVVCVYAICAKERGGLCLYGRGHITHTLACRCCKIESA